VKQEAVEYIEYGGYEEGSEMHKLIEEWDGGNDELVLEDVYDGHDEGDEALKIARYEYVD
jgi:hypothetical protein